MNFFEKPFVLSGFVFVFGLAVFFAGHIFSERVLAASNAPGNGERLITIHDDSEEYGLLTRAATPRQAFKEAGVTVDANDLVEPGLDETLIASSYDINIYRARPVTVVDGAVRKRIMSAYRTPEQIVAHAGMQLHAEDLTDMSLPLDRVHEGAAIQLSIDRATPFTLVLYGKRTTVYTQADTVADFLLEKDITMSAEDTLSVSTGSPLTAGMTVEIWRNGLSTFTEEQEVPFATERIQDVDRDASYREVKTPGVKGKRMVTYEIEMKNGQEVHRKEIQSVTTKEPVKQVEVVGTKITAPAGSLSPAEAKIVGREMMLAYGFGEDQWPCLEQLWNRESGWRTTASNPSGAYGIPQALPGSKMGAGWQTDSRVQINWGLGYVKSRYQTPCGAWNAFLSKGWY